MNHETDRALDGYLIVLVQGGSRDAFDRLARRWSPRLMRYVTRVLGRPEAAADIVQETWLAAIRGLTRLDDASRFPAWIYSIAHRKCIDGMRFNQRHRRLIEGVTAESIVASEVKQSSTGSNEDPDLATAM